MDPALALRTSRNVENHLSDRPSENIALSAQVLAFHRRIDGIQNLMPVHAPRINVQITLKPLRTLLSKLLEGEIAFQLHELCRIPHKRLQFARAFLDDSLL